MSRLGLSLLLSSVGIGAMSPAFAQQAPVESEDDIIVVTALKRETDLQSTPISISVLGAADMEQRHVQSLLDLADGSVPGLRITTFESRQSAVTVGIRGIVPNDANQPAREQGVGVYIDGVYLGRQHGLNAALLDIERVEVLKGPQGTLFGRNTEGGAVSMVTRQPSGEFEFRTTAGISNFNGYNWDAHLDLPEFANISLKLDGVLQYRDPVVENPMGGQTGWGYYDRRGFRVSALWRPTADFNATYAFDTGQDQNSPYYSQLVNYNVAGRPIATTFPVPSGQIAPLPPAIRVHTDRQSVADIGVPQQPSVDETQGHSLHLNWDLSDNLSLRSITAYRDVSVEQFDNAGGANRVPAFAPNAAFSRYSIANFNQFQRSQEFQLVGDFGDRFEYVLGLYYFNEKVWDDAATPNTLTWNATGTGYTVRDPMTFPGSARGFRSIDRASTAWAESRGVFLHTVWTPPVLNDNLHITLGGRQTRDEKHGVLRTVNNAPRNFTFSEVNDRFDPVVTFAYDVTDDVNVYATYATGYRAGGASSRSLTYRSFGPEEVESYELGLKTYLFDRLRFNLALFNMERTGSQIDFTLVAPDPVTGASRNTVETINAPGVSEMRGVELETQLEVSDNLRLTFAYAYTDTNVPPARNPFTGVTQNVYIIYTPRNVASVGLDYEHPLSFGALRFHIDANYSDGAHSFEQFSDLTDSSFIVNARVALADVTIGDAQNVSFALWSRNLLDEEHIYRRSAENRSTLGDYANVNEPRTVGAEVSLRF